MNRREFVNRLFLFTGALSSGLWVPRPPPFTIIPWARESTCMKRIYSQEYLESLHNDGKPLDIDEIFRLALLLKKAREDRGMEGIIVVIPRSELEIKNIVV